MQHLFDKFSKPRKSKKAQTETTVLSKVCMFGDPKQRTSYRDVFECQRRLFMGESDLLLIVPPFGSEAAPKMQTIFDFQHLKTHAYFLDTQCT